MGRWPWLARRSFVHRTPHLQGEWDLGDPRWCPWPGAVRRRCPGRSHPEDRLTLVIFGHTDINIELYKIGIRKWVKMLEPLMDTVSKNGQKCIGKQFMDILYL